MIFRKYYKQYYLTFCLIAAFQPAFTQSVMPDSIGKPIIDTLIPSLVNKVAAYTSTIDHNTFILQRKINITPIVIGLPELERSIKGFKSRLEKRGRQMNLRSLNSGTILLKEITTKLGDYKILLSNYSKQLTSNNKEVKRIIYDQQLRIQVPDSMLMEQLQELRIEARRLDSMQQYTLVRVNLMRNRVSVHLLQANDIMSDMSYLGTAIRMSIWMPQDAPLFRASYVDYLSSWEDITVNALQRSARIIGIYVGGKWQVLTVSLLIFIFITTWCFINMRRVRRTGDPATVMEPMHFLSRSVLVSSLMGFSTYSPLLYANPTMSFLHANEVLRLLALSYLIYPYLAKKSRVLWILLSLLWVYYVLDDILLEAAFGERWGLFIAGILLTGLCIKLITNKTGFFVKIKESSATKALVIFSLAQVVMSTIFNLTGHLTLAKIFGISSVQSLMLGITLKIFCQLVLEAIYLQSEAYHDSRFSDFINYNVLQHRFERILWILASIVWFVALLRYLTLFDLASQLVSSFFTTPRMIGSMAFTFESVAVFIFIIWISSVISRVINFFFGNKNVVYSDKRSGLGSIMLLVRLAIWSLGFLVAVAATGIPLDKISLMIGALGVGIGFGLQNIVNNLVSGVILAFERPIQVGDEIEIGNKAGVIKEIGVRSSKIKSVDGADIIVPNGDLLSQHLINWTMQDRNKRVEFVIGVTYEADLKQVKSLIQETLLKNENILQPPEPIVILQAFTDLAIDVKILFWASELSRAGTLRSNVMTEVFEALNAAGVPLAHAKK